MKNQPIQVLAIKTMKIAEDAKLPEKAHITDAAFDLFANLDEDYIILEPWKGLLDENGYQPTVIPTGIAMEIPDGFFGKIESRSGLASKQGLVTAGGVIDSGYRGEIKVIMMNHSNQEVKIHNGDKIAQMVIHHIPFTTIEIVDSLGKSDRGTKGFGSTGGVKNA